MANTYYITAGLPVSKDESVTPSSGVNTFYVTAGLPPEVLEDEEESTLLIHMLKLDQFGGGVLL